MASNDSFDKVLRELGLYQQLQDTNSIPIATIPALQIQGPEVPCRIQAIDLTGNSVAISSIPIAVRAQLALKLIKFVHSTHETATRIHPISLILYADGMVLAEPVHMVHVGNPPGAYPARYHLPMSTINDLPLQERVWRAEKFALGMLIYELLTGCRIFEGVSDNDIQSRYGTATFPKLEELPIPDHYLIYACWSAEFGDYVALGKFVRYVQDNPARFALQATCAVISTAALITIPVLGAIGFSGIGPVAGTVAAGWQASIGAVEAGSLFALCQSAAMGGAAATGLIATGAGAGAAAAAATGLPRMLSLRKTFKMKFRRGPN